MFTLPAGLIALFVCAHRYYWQSVIYVLVVALGGVADGLVFGAITLIYFVSIAYASFLSTR